MSSCAIGPCGNPHCYLCTVVTPGRVTYQVHGGPRGSQPITVTMKIVHAFPRHHHETGRNVDQETVEKETVECLS